MKKILYSFFFSLLTVNALSARHDIKTASPSEKLEVNIAVDTRGVKLILFDSLAPVLEADLGRFVFKGNDLWEAYHISSVKQTSTDEDWNPVYGERNIVHNTYNEVVVTLAGKDTADKRLQLICRVYDEGIAFRYLFDQESVEDLVLEKELTSFSFDSDYDAWITDRAQGVYKKEKISKIKVASERPLVIKRNEISYLALGESALVDFARMKFARDPDQLLSLQVDLAGKVDLKKAGYITPWRYVMVAGSPGELLENNYFIQNLNESRKLEDVSWIKPGKIIREVTLTTKGGIACIDFAARHNLQFVEFDAGWYGNEYDDESDASTVTVDPRRSPGPLDLHQVIDHANQKGVGIILYVNRRALEKQLDLILPLYQSWGIKGLKYGFVNVGTQEWTSWLHEAVHKAASYQLMVDVHDEYRPTGYSRTYPNLMTQEGIRGDEESPSTEHTLITLFTRMIAGAGDNTNCYFAPRVSEKMGGRTAQMAKAVLLYSPWQFLYWYDRPEGSPSKKGGAGSSVGIIIENEELEFFDALPADWDETIVLEGKIGEYATMARRNGENWFVGALVANQEREIKIPLEFLDERGSYEAVVFSQNREDLENGNVSIQKFTVDQRSVLSTELLRNSGLAVILRKI